MKIEVDLATAATEDGERVRLDQGPSAAIELALYEFGSGGNVVKDGLNHELPSLVGDNRHSRVI